jgi:hypothetical protein
MAWAPCQENQSQGQPKDAWPRLKPPPSKKIWIQVRAETAADNIVNANETPSQIRLKRKLVVTIGWRRRKTPMTLI